MTNADLYKEELKKMVILHRNSKLRCNNLEDRYKQQTATVDRLLSENIKLQKEIETLKTKWISLKDNRPKLKVSIVDKQMMIESTIDCIVTDGNHVWNELYCKDLGFHEAITHFIRIDSIRPPK